MCRICGICSCMHGISYCEVVERLWPMEVPPCQVLAHHLVRDEPDPTTCSGLDCWQMHWDLKVCSCSSGGSEKKFLTLLEMTCGSRVTQSVSLSVVCADIDDEQKKICIRTLQEVRKEVEAWSMFWQLIPQLACTVGVGVLTKEQAILLQHGAPPEGTPVLRRTQDVRDAAMVSWDLSRL